MASGGTEETHYLTIIKCNKGEGSDFRNCRKQIDGFGTWSVVPTIDGDDNGSIDVEAGFTSELSVLGNKILNTRALYPFPVNFIFPCDIDNNDAGQRFWQGNRTSSIITPGFISVATYDTTEGEFRDGETDIDFICFPSKVNVQSMFENPRLMVFNIKQVNSVSEKYIHFAFKTPDGSILTNFYRFDDSDSLFEDFDPPFFDNKIILYNKYLGFGSVYVQDLEMPSGKQDSFTLDAAIYKDGTLEYMVYDIPIYLAEFHEIGSDNLLTDAYLKIDNILNWIIDEGGGYYTVRFLHTDSSNNFTSFFEIHFNILVDFDNAYVLYSGVHEKISLGSDAIHPSYGLYVKTDVGYVNFLTYGNVEPLHTAPSSAELVIRRAINDEEDEPMSNSLWSDHWGGLYWIDSNTFPLDCGDIKIISPLRIEYADPVVSLDTPNLSCEESGNTLDIYVNNFPEEDGVELVYSFTGADWTTVDLIDNHGTIDVTDSGGMVYFRYRKGSQVSEIYNYILRSHGGGEGEAGGAEEVEEESVVYEVEREYVAISDSVINTFKNINNFFVSWDFSLDDSYNGFKVYLYGDKVDNLKKYVSFDGGPNIEMDTNIFYYKGKKSTLEGDFKNCRLSLGINSEFDGFIRRAFIEFIE